VERVTRIELAWPAGRASRSPLPFTSDAHMTGVTSVASWRAKKSRKTQRRTFISKPEALVAPTSTAPQVVVCLIKTRGYGIGQSM
jgi:hypothetical protein